MKIFIGFIIAFLIGASCQLFKIPLPAPVNLLGAFLVLSITCGYLIIDFLLIALKRKK